MGVFDGMGDIFVGILDDGIPVRIVPKNADAYLVPGVFREEYVAVDAGGYAGVDVQQSAFSVTPGDLGAFDPARLVDGGFVDRGDRRFRIVSVQPDGRAMIRLVLERAGTAPEYVEGVA